MSGSMPTMALAAKHAANDGLTLTRLDVPNGGLDGGLKNPCQTPRHWHLCNSEDEGG